MPTWDTCAPTWRSPPPGTTRRGGAGGASPLLVVAVAPRRARGGGGGEYRCSSVTLGWLDHTSGSRYLGKGSTPPRRRGWATSRSRWPSPSAGSGASPSSTCPMKDSGLICPNRERMIPGRKSDDSIGAAECSEGGGNLGRARCHAVPGEPCWCQPRSWQYGFDSTWRRRLGDHAAGSAPSRWWVIGGRSSSPSHVALYIGDAIISPAELLATCSGFYAGGAQA